MLEKNIINAANVHLKALKALADNHIDFQDVYSVYCEIKGLVDLRRIEPNHLTDEAVSELILIDNLANLTMRSVSPEAIKVQTEQGARLDEYMAMTERELVDLIFKHGGRFNNPDAISVAMFKNIIDDVTNEHAAYERLRQREQSDDGN